MSVYRFKRRVVILFSAMFFLANAVQAKPAEWKKTTGDFTAILILTDKPKIYAKTWTKAKNKLPTGMIAKSIKKSKLVVAMVFFKGCSGDNRGQCDAEIMFSVYQPNGKLYAKRAGLSLWKSGTIKSGLMLSAANLALSFDAKDPVGKYKIVVKIKDNVSNKKLTLTRIVTVSN